MSILLYLFFPILLCSLSIYIYKTTSIKETLLKHWKLILIFLLFNFIFLNLYAFFRLRTENFIPFWDWAGYYKKTIEILSSLSNEGFKVTIAKIYNSMLYNDYSYFAETFLLLPVRLIGNTYPRYIIAILNFFIIPTNCLVFIFSLNYFECNKKRVGLTFLIITLFTSNLAATFYGYIGSVGMFFIVAILILTYLKPLNKKDILNDIIIGILLLLLVLIRRWYSYFVIAYFLSVLISEIINAISAKTLSYKFIKTLILHLFIRGITASIVLVIGFYPLFLTYLTNDYSIAYQAYALDNKFQYIKLFYNHYAPFIIWLSVFGVIYNIIYKKHLRLTLFCVTSTIIIFVLFTSVQQIDTHHYYLMNIMMLLLTINGIDIILQLIKKPIATRLFMILISFLLILNFYCSFEINSINTKSFVTIFITKNNYPPRITEGKTVVEDLVNYLNEVDQEYEYIYVLASSSLLNDDMLMNAFLPDDLYALNQLESTHVWDTRDGAPELFFKYTYIIVCDPIQYNNNISQQKIFETLANGMLNDHDLQIFYQLEKTFRYIDDITIYVYKLNGVVSNDIITKYENIIKAYYPDYPELCEFAR